MVHFDGTCIERLISPGGGSANTIFELGPQSKWHSKFDKPSKHPHEVVLALKLTDLTGTQTSTRYSGPISCEAR